MHERRAGNGHSNVLRQKGLSIKRSKSILDEVALPANICFSAPAVLPANAAPAGVSGLTFDMSGGPKRAQRALVRPLDGEVRFELHVASTTSLS